MRLSLRVLLMTLVLIGHPLARPSFWNLAYAQDEAVSPQTENEPTPDREPAAQSQPREPAAQSRRRAKTKTTTRTTTTKATPAAAASAASDEGLRIAKIEIRGNKKIETDAVTARLVSKTGEGYTAEKIRADVDALFKTGFFYDIRVDRNVRGQEADLTYTVVEKPSITEIVYRGNSEIENDDLRDASGLKAFEILNMTKLREATEKLQKLYEDKGFFLARISPKVETVKANETVKIVFDIQENDKVKVKRVTFLGNKNINDGRLKGAMQTQEGSFFSFISGSGAYKQDAFDRDIQLLNYIYFNEGYVQVRVDRPQVYVTPDKKGIYITIRVDEGDRFKVGNVDFAGDLLFDRDELYNATEIDGSGWYVHETLLKDLRTLQAKYGDLGYAYANIIPRTRIRDKDKEVDITFEIDKGNKVYFNRINVVGNSKTRDKVVRRELTIREGELYNETRRRESLDNVKRLGYFDDVTFNTSTPTDNADLMNVDIVVKERNTGSIQVGAGYSTYSQFIFNGQVNQINLFGKGQRLGVSVDLSSNQSLFNLNFTEPYVFDSEWSLGFDAYQSKRTTYDNTRPLYEETKKGGAVRIGHPLAPFLRGYLRYKLDNTQIGIDEATGDQAIYPVPTAANPNPDGNPNGLTSSATLTLEYDKRNDRYLPSAGVYGSVSLEYAGLGGDKRYTKGLATGRFYQKLFWEFVFRNNLTYGFIRANDANSKPPYNELFLLGGANSLRGFDWYSIGHKRFSQKRYDCLVAPTNDTNVCPSRPGDPLSPDAARKQANLPFGGEQEISYNAEIEFPLISEAGIKGVVFYDVGMAEDYLPFSSLRQDIGFGFRWISPIGPLRFEWGFPLDRDPDIERAMNFQFAIGAPF